MSEHGHFPILMFFHPAIGGWTSPGVDKEGDCRSEAVTAAIHLVPSVNDKEGTAIMKLWLFAYSQNLT